METVCYPELEIGPKFMAAWDFASWPYSISWSRSYHRSILAYAGPRVSREYKFC